MIVAQLSPEFTARLADRWQELEGAARKTAELTREEILVMALETERERKRLAAELEKSQQDKLDRSKQYVTIKRMSMLYHSQKFDWRLLKSTSTEMGIEPIDVFDANYGTAKAYHIVVWREAYAIELPEAA